MSKTKVKLLSVTFLVVIILKVFVPVISATESDQQEEAEVLQQVEAITPLSIEMVDQTMAVLSDGWSGLSPAEQGAFLTIYDPAATGEIDEQFLATVLDNYQKIRQALDNDIEVKYEAEDERCEGMQLYYTDIVSLHVCPYFLVEANDTRRARTLIHEFAHIALRVTDRPYYRPTSKRYAELTPRGPQAAQLPLIGPVIREIVGGDTLYHPDTYAHFAVAASGQASARELFLNYGIGEMNDGDNSGLQEERTDMDIQATDSWATTQ